METLTFGSFFRALMKGTNVVSNRDMFDAIMNPIIENERIINAKGEPYYFSDPDITKLSKNGDPIPSTISDAVEDIEIREQLQESFRDVVIGELFTPTKETNTYDTIIGILNTDSSIGPTKHDELIALFDSGAYDEFLTEVYCYALQCPNKIKKPKKALFEKELQELTSTLNKFGRPEKIEPPSELDDKEEVYVNELLAAYGEDAGEEYDNIDELPQKYAKNFNRQRSDYYNAESIRLSSRDVYSSDEGNLFEEFKAETFDGIIDVVEDDYDTGFDRLKSVTKHAGNLNYSKSALPRIPNWIGPSEKKGTCHILVNDKKIKWVDEDE